MSETVGCCRSVGSEMTVPSDDSGSCFFSSKSWLFFNLAIEGRNEASKLWETIVTERLFD